MRIFPDNLAIVGNSDKETGLGSGPIIDSYEHVLRFNNWSTAEQFWPDYGKKTTMWSHCMHRSVVDRKGQKFDKVFIPFPLFDKRCPRKYDTHESLFWDFEEETILMPYFLFKDLFSLIDMQFGVKPHPSTGISLLYWVWRDRDTAINSDDCFGFAGFNPQYKHHYFIENNKVISPNLINEHNQQVEQGLFTIFTTTSPSDWSNILRR